MKKIDPLLALTTAALSLPVFAGNPPTEKEISLRASSYKEDDISKTSVLSGSPERYKIDKTHFRLLTPIGSNWSTEINTSQEVMSGASPWGTFSGSDEQPSLIMSGATIKDKRTEVGVSITNYQDNASYGVTLGTSHEDDYKSRSIGLSAGWDLNNMSTLGIGFSFSDDDIEPTDAKKFGRIQQAKKQTRSFSVSWTQIINANSLLFSGLTYTNKEGFLSDPYKLRDTRPDKKSEWAASLKYRIFIDSKNAALHLNYRLYNDGFGINSHTVNAEWHQNISLRWKISPRIRYYSQSQADFYLDADDFSLPKTVNQSSDHRLSGYGAITAGIQANYELSGWKIKVGFDRYISDNHYGHDSSRYSHPALLDFNLTSLGIEYKF
ncbi:MAG: hypothetical protein CMQ40_02360 [Gammaproteobacteria bacterium]|nr:hypothetical protein [Gammaproteobacteria bacterium]